MKFLVYYVTKHFLMIHSFHEKCLERINAWDKCPICSPLFGPTEIKKTHENQNNQETLKKDGKKVLRILNRFERNIANDIKIQDNTLFSDMKKGNISFSSDSQQNFALPLKN